MLTFVSRRSNGKNVLVPYESSWKGTPAISKEIVVTIYTLARVDYLELTYMPELWSSTSTIISSLDRKLLNRDQSWVEDHEMELFSKELCGVLCRMC